MSKETQAILEAALALPDPEREQLVARLLESLPSQVDELTDDEFHAELDRRHAEFQADPSIGVPWEEVLKED